MVSRDRWIFLGPAALVLLYIVLRALLVPLNHDEARTFFVYTRSGAFLPWLSHWDAGNHLLCTALGWISYKAFGMAPFALRLANVLAFAVYAWYVWRMGAWVSDRLVRWSLWCALLCMPVLIEFFALYRGYGLGMAFLMMALFHTVQAARTAAPVHVLAGLAGWSLATAAMLSLLILCCAGLAVLLLVVLTARSGLWRRALLALAWVVLGVLPAWGAALYGSALKERGLLYYGSEEGLYAGTWRSVTWMFMGELPPWARALMAALALAAVAVTVVRVMQRPREMRKAVATVVVVLLLCELFGRLLMGEAFHVVYPLDRTALQFMPLTVLVVALSIDHLGGRVPSLRPAALLLLALPLRTIATANFSHTAIWPQETVSHDIVERAMQVQQDLGRPLLIDAYNQMAPQWDHARLMHAPGLSPVGSAGFPQGHCDLLLIDTTYFTTPPGFRTLATSASGRQVLKQRRYPLQFALMRDSVLAPGPLDSEFRTLWEPVATDLLGMEPVLDLELALRTTDPVMGVLLVIEVDGAEGEHLHYEIIELGTLRLLWDGGPVHLYRRIPPLAGNTRRVVCYLWNQWRQPVELTQARIRTLRIQPDTDLRNPD